jgi:hypothetical protein
MEWMDRSKTVLGKGHGFLSGAPLRKFAIGATRRRFPAHHTILVMYGDKAQIKRAVTSPRLRC